MFMFSMHCIYLLCFVVGWGGGGGRKVGVAYNRCHEVFQPENHNCLWRKLFDEQQHVPTFDRAFSQATTLFRFVDQAF